MTEKRFKETISTGIVTDTITGKEYNCEIRIDDELLKLINELANENEQLKEDGLYWAKTAEARRKEIDRLRKENEQLKQSYKEFEDECQSTFNAMSRKQNDLYRKNFKLKEENEQLKQTLEDLRTYSNDEIKEAEHINTIYKEQGFKGVIDYAKDKLQNYGVVREVEIGLWEMVTGGWSDNEFWLHCLNNPVSIFGMKHYRGYLRGGAFYYTEKARGDVEIILKGDVE